MTYRPYIDFQEVKEKCPIPEVLEKLGLADQFTRKGDTLSGICPIKSHCHGPKPNASQFKINRKDGVWVWHCFGDCQRGGDVIELVKAVKELSDAHVRFWFAENFGDRLGQTKKDQRPSDVAAKQPPASEPTAAPEEASKPIKPLSFYLSVDPTVPYLRQRGLTDEIIGRYGLGLAKKGVLAGYVAIPIHRWPKQAADENPVGYIGRWPGDDFDEADGRPRYKIPPEFEVSRLVYGLNEALSVGTAQRSPLIVVEGPFKVFHLVQAGFPCTVSTLTANVSDQQAELLIKTSRPIVLMFDGNEAGYKAMRGGAAKLIAQTFVRVVKLPYGVEPDHLSGEELKRFLSWAKPGG